MATTISKPECERFLIGTYRLGYKWIDVWADPDKAGGNFNCVPKNRERDNIVIGFDYDYVSDPLMVTIHEAMESLLCDMRCRFRETDAYEVGASDCYIFHFDHNQFTEIASRLAAFLEKLYPDLVAAFELIKEGRKALA